jgi:hypothetical protein
MKLKNIAAAACAALLLSSTAGVAQASSAQALSLKGANAARVSTDAGKSNELVGASAWVLAAIGLGLVVWGVVELSNDDEPDSP